MIEHGGALDRAIAEHGGTHADWLDLPTEIQPAAYPLPDLPHDVWTRLPDGALEQQAVIAARA